MSDAPWLDKARNEVGLKEIPGTKHNPKVIGMFAEAGHPWVKDDETAWCAAFANAMLGRAGFVGTGSLAARSFLNWGKSLGKKVKPGAIAVFKRGNQSWQGHVGFLTGQETTSHVEVIGGNQGNAVSRRMYAKADLLDTRWPSVVGNSRTVKAQVVSLGGTAVGVMGETANTLLPLAQEAAQWSKVMVYVAFGVAAIAAVCTLVFRIQDIARGK